MAASGQIQCHTHQGITVVEYIYNGNVQYEKGDFRYVDSKEGLSSAYSPPSREPSLQNVLRLSDKNLKVIEETVLRMVIPESDGREHVENSDRYPNSIHSQLEMRFPDGSYGGSGAMVGPHHVLTCAHNVYNAAKQHWAESIQIFPAKKGNYAPFGKAQVTRAYIFGNWRNQGDQNFDMALLILDQSIGQLTGWGGMCCSKDDSLKDAVVHITGYPGDKGFDNMWTMSHRIQQVFSETFEYVIDTAGGQSGSAIWSKEWEHPIILGVHTLGGGAANYGVRISREKFNALFIPFISGTYVKTLVKTASSIYHMVIQNQDRFFQIRVVDGRDVYCGRDTPDLWAQKRDQDTNTSSDRRLFKIIPVEGKDEYFELKVNNGRELKDVYVHEPCDSYLKSSVMSVANKGEDTNTQPVRRQFRITSVLGEGGVYELFLENNRNVYVSSMPGRPCLFAVEKGSSSNTSDSRRRFIINLV